MKNITVHFKIDNNNLTNEEKVYNKILIMCMSFEDREIDCYPILPIYFEILNLDNSEFRDLFITTIRNKNFVLGDIFFDQGVEINHEEIIDAFKDHCINNQIEIVYYLINKDFHVSTKIKNEIISEFENSFIPEYSKRNTVDFIEKVWIQNRLMKINKLKDRILKTQKKLDNLK